MVKRGRKRRTLEVGAVYGSWQVVRALPFRQTGRSVVQCIYCGKISERINTIVKGGSRCHCVSRRGHAWPKNQAMRQAVQDLRHQRLSYREIGRQLGISGERVRQLLADVGCAGPIGLPTCHKIDVDVKELRRLYDQGFNTQRIGRSLGVSGMTVIKRAREIGLEVGHDHRKAVLDARDLGRQNGFLVVLEIERPGRDRLFVCLCDSRLGGCGLMHTVAAGNFGRTRSCGCLAVGRRRAPVAAPGLPEAQGDYMVT